MKTNPALSFPVSPAFVHNYSTSKAVQLKPVHTFCSQNNIPFSAEEDKYYKLKQAKVRFNKFSKALNQCYETARPDVFDTGMSLLEDKEGRPDEIQVSPEFTDLRNYVPELGLAK